MNYGLRKAITNGELRIMGGQFRMMWDPLPCSFDSSSLKTDFLVGHAELIKRDC